MLSGLRLAANSLEASMGDLSASAPTRRVDVRRLCAASFSAGRLVGYMEALEASDAGLASTMAVELQRTLRSVDDVRRRFEVTV